MTGFEEKLYLGALSAMRDLSLEELVDIRDGLQDVTADQAALDFANSIVHTVIEEKLKHRVMN